MALLPEQKAEVVTAHKRSDQDTGSPEVQVALLTKQYGPHRHFKAHKRPPFASWAAQAGRSSSETAQLLAQARHRAISGAYLKLGIRK